ncbi:MAG: nicotinate-nucleotide adenylyltransferase [Rhodothermia bacterium]|nr:nicotinate-nucleotide adenylyltransferase [Rhodothermia bacterium]
MRTGIFGGSFDPPHLGHLVVAEGIRDLLDLDRVIWIPAATAPHKREEKQSSAKHRSEMVQMTVSDNESFQHSDLEVSRGGVSYTVDTLEHLKRRYPADEMFLLLGMDSYAGFGTWREPKKITELASLLVYPRGDVDLVESSAFEAMKLALPRVEISSSMIRKRVRAGESIRYLVTDAVLGYIAKHKLYLD